MISESEEKRQKKFNHLLFERMTDLLWKILICVFVLGAAHYCRRIILAERFRIPTESMNPTLVPGDKVWVNKLLYGARIYKSFNFEDHVPLSKH